MTRPIMAAHARDWPLPPHMWELFVCLVVLAVLSIAAREVSGAERPREGEHESPARATDAAPVALATHDRERSHDVPDRFALLWTNAERLLVAAPAPRAGVVGTHPPTK